MTMQQVVIQHRSKLVGFFKKKGVNLWDAEELAQDVLIKFLKYYERVNCTNTGAYLYTIAHTIYIDSLRKRTRSKECVIDDREWEKIEMNMTRISDSPDLLLEAEELFVKMYDSIGKLTDARKQAYTLYHIEGYTYAEIALQRNVSVSAVEKNIYQATSIVNRAMERQLGFLMKR